MNAKPITENELSAWSKAYNDSAERQLATLAFSKTDVADAVYSCRDAFSMTQTFSIEIPTMRATDQQKSGRCWLFAATNVLRERVAKALELEDFQLSQSYLAFWDKFERCNYFLESVLDTAELPIDDRTVSFILSGGVYDGGQWEMFANIARKYGIVPREVYGETKQSCGTASMNHYLNRALKHAAARLRGMYADGAPMEALRAEKEEILGKIYGFLCSCYTEPPKTFDFEYVDKNKQYHVERGLTPLTFFDRYARELLDETASIINAPTADKPWHKTYTVKYLGNVVGGNPIRHLNLPIDEFKAAILRQLEAGKVVWFGADSGKFGNRELGVWDDRCFHAEQMTGLDLELSKAEALDYHYSAMGHAMVFTGVNVADGKPNRWKIENSWGEKSGSKGYYVCSDSWFDKYVYQAAVEKEYLGELAPLYMQAPVELAPWDPMGTLAD